MQHERRGIFVLESAMQIAKAESLANGKTIYVYSMNNSRSGIEYIISDKMFLANANIISGYKNGLPKVVTNKPS